MSVHPPIHDEAIMNKKLFLAALVAASPIHPGWALHGENDFGPVGIVRGQTVRINVVNPSESPHHACPLVLSFLDAAGKEIGRSSSLVLDSGQADHFDLNGDSLQLARGERKQIRAHISLSLRGGGYACRHVIATEEVFDNETGHTEILNPVVIERFTPHRTSTVPAL
jgi:hypothetical protein